jgi:hypothetical protein
MPVRQEALTRGASLLERGAVFGVQFRQGNRPEQPRPFHHLRPHARVDKKYAVAGSWPIPKPP